MDQTLYATSVPFAQWFTVLLRVGAPGALTRVGLFRVNARAAFARDFFRVSAPGSQSSLGTSQGLCARRAETREIFSRLCASRAEAQKSHGSLSDRPSEVLAPMKVEEPRPEFAGNLIIGFWTAAPTGLRMPLTY